MNHAAIIASATTAPRRAASVSAPTPPTVTAGLELSDIVYKPASWFRPNPANDVFRTLKTESYLADLEADIRANGVTENLVAMPDGLILSGESRAICGLRIGPDYRLPVRLVLSELAPEEQEKRLILSNLLRFEIPEDVRLILARRAGLFSHVLRADAASIMGKSLRQVKRDAAVIREAEERAEAEGREEPTADDVAAVREKKNSARRAPARDRGAVTGSNNVRILLTPILDEMASFPLSDVNEYARKIREALGWRE